MKKQLRWDALLVSVLVSAVPLTSSVGKAAASDVVILIPAVEGQAVTAVVGTYTSAMTANERFITQTYLDLLGRRPSPAELALFDSMLGSGGTRIDVANAVLATDEYRSAVVTSIFNAYLHRLPSSTERAGWVALLAAGASDEQASATVLGSIEYFQNRGGSTIDGFLHALFLDVLGRPIDSGSEAIYLSLATTTTRAEIALDVLVSSESRTRLVTGIFEQFLDRSPSASELQVFVQALQSGATDENVIADVIGSDEYLANAFASATVDWGDGTPTTAATLAGALITGSHTYAEEGDFTITVTVHDLDGTSTITSMATVSDAPLSATPTSFGVLKRMPFSGTVATFTDANPAAPVSDFTASIDWGDGQVTTGVINMQAGGVFAVAGSHTFKGRGDYPVTVTVRDDGGSTATAVGVASVVNKSGK
jgi:hypothetical protein